MINILNAPFNGQNNGVGSNYAPIMAAITQAIANGGDEIYFPPGTYKIKGSAGTTPPVYKTGMNRIKLYGKGAIIVCDTDTTAGSGINGSGGGLSLYGDNILVEDLRFEGVIGSIGNSAFGNGALIKLQGNYNCVENC